jgi:NAD(P)-dependent dehydrogenase (short-subunit alcohol dehydrogenase family)
MQSIRQLIDLTGRKALVTGGAGHIGLAVCETLLELGANLAILDVDPEACNSRAADLSQRFGSAQVLAIVSDLANEQATRKSVRDAITGLGGLGILIHCAAFVGTSKIPGWAVPFEKQDFGAFQAALGVNAGSAFVMAQEARQALIDSGHGSIVLFSSIYGMVGPDLRLYDGTTMANPAAYGVSKGGLVQFMRYLATTLAPHVRANCISPGGIERKQPQSFQERYVQRTPLRRMAMEEDLKGAIAYLCSDLSQYVTGHNLVVDGGWTAW